ncbi:MAG TPA: hypothetical protein VF257_03095 [Solirubrobacteraceae bacterium]
MSLAARATRRRVLTVAATLAACATLGVALAAHSHEFTAALRSAPLGVLALVAALQLVALLARTEAWYVCVRATGSPVARRRLYRASSVGSVAVVVNGQIGLAARLAVLRRTCPRESPRIAALLAAELPIVATEAALAALFSFTLVGPLGLAWWWPLVAFAAMALVGAGLCKLARARPRGPWSGLAVLRSLDGRSRVIALVIVAVVAQIARNYLVLRSTGVAVSLLDSIAVLIAMVSLSQLPFGPSVGAAATVLILGAHGTAVVAAAGVLLTATGTAGALGFAAWGAGDWFADGRIKLPRRAPSRRSARSSALSIRTVLGALPARHRREIELAYFGGLNQSEMARWLYLPLALAPAPSI